VSHPRVFAEQYPGSEVADALREHRGDRDALLASLTATLQRDPCVRAAWLWGSFGRGAADDLSDLDPWIIVSDGAVGAMGPSLRLYAQRTGNVIHGRVTHSRKTDSSVGDSSNRYYLTRLPRDESWRCPEQGLIQEAARAERPHAGTLRHPPASSLPVCAESRACPPSPEHRVPTDSCPG
jgi:predicted nucleotidyltransferase